MRDERTRRAPRWAGWRGRSRPGLGRWAAVAGIWSAVAVFSVLQIYLAQTALGHPPPLLPLLALELPVWAFWALATVPVVMLARRLPLHRAGWSGVTLHVGAAIALALVAVAFQMLWYQAFNPYPLGGASVWEWFWQYFRRYFVVGFMIYWAAVGVYHAFEHWILYRERELDATQARAQLTEARLGALKMQLQPHFLFNSLNSISALVEDRPRTARLLIAQLADLLRASLRSEARHEISLADELEFVERYLDIERVRFGDRLEVRMDIEPCTLGAAVPSFLLQPLVENAIRHGIGQRDDGGRLWIHAARSNGALVVDVADNGPGVGGRLPREGTGLANTRRRLAELYGARQTLSMGDRPGGGFQVRVTLPWTSTEPGR